MKIKACTEAGFDCLQRSTHNKSLMHWKTAFLSLSLSFLFQWVLSSRVHDVRLIWRFQMNWYPMISLFIYRRTETPGVCFITFVFTDISKSKGVTSKPLSSKEGYTCFIYAESCCLYIARQGHDAEVWSIFTLLKDVWSICFLSSPQSWLFCMGFSIVTINLHLLHELIASVVSTIAQIILHIQHYGILFHIHIDDC